MPALPPVADFTDNNMSAVRFSNAVAQLRDYLAELLGSAGSVPEALATLGALVGGVSLRSAAGSVTLADRGRLLRATAGSWTLSLPPAATAGTGFAVLLAVDPAAGTITIDPDGAEQIDGAATAALAPGRAALVVCDGTAWHTLALPGRAAGPLLAQDGSAAAPSLAFGSDPDTGLWRIAADTLGIATGGAERLRVTNSGVQLTGSLTGTAVQASATDLTAGRLLTVGAFGLGATGSTGDQITTAAQLDGLRGLRVDRVAGADVATIGGPSGSLGAAVVTVGYGTAHQIQFWHEVTGQFRTWRRNFVGSSWSSWKLLTNLSTSNANGVSYRYSEGEQRCIRTDISVASVATVDGVAFESADVTWTFPQAFLTGSIPVLNVNGANSDVIGYRIMSISETAVTFRLRARASIGSSVTIRAEATGRWA